VWQTFAPEYREAPCAFEVTRLPTRVTCGYVLVPENRAEPNSRLIRLAVLHVEGADPAPNRAVVHLAGGPGGSAIEFLYHGDGASDDLSALAAYGDLILVDARGTGYSEPSICKGVRGGGPPEEDESRFREAMRHCLSDARSRGIWLDGLSTWHVALDTRDVRRALGEERWNLWGLSYGTRLAEAVMQVDPEGVRAVILDSTSPPFFPTSLAHGLRSSLDAVTRACSEHVRCSEDVGDLAGRLVDAVATYDEEPLEIDGLDERFWPGGRLTVDSDVLASSLLGTLYSSSNHDDLPSVLTVLEQRNAEAIRVAAQGRAPGPRPSWGAAMGLITNCRWDLPTPDSLAAWRAAEPVLDRWLIASEFGRNARERCEELYQVDSDPSVRSLVSDIPTLMLSGLADPITPPSFTSVVATGLTKATIIQVPHTGHNVIRHLNRYSPGCGTALMHAFFADPEGQVELPCPDAVQPPDFVTRLRQTARLSRFFFGLFDGNRPILPAVALLVLLWTAVAYPVAAIARRIDGRPEPDLTRIRTLSWSGAVLSLGGAALALSIIYRMATQNQMSILVGWLPSIAWAGWLALAGVATSVAAVVLHVRSRRERAPRIATTFAVAASALSSVLLFVFLLTLGAGPI
jgi:pimeloyl-ACP methyl ester carboxylesterase